MLDLNGIEPVPACSDSDRRQERAPGAALYALARRPVRPGKEQLLRGKACNRHTAGLREKAW